ncbi:MAG: class I SAM-dependent methyltransferase [Acidimicrobiia bacterium]
MDNKPWSRFRAGLYSLIFRSPKSNRLLVEFLGLEASDRTLDVGCGPGAAVRLAAGVVAAGEAVGVDRAEAMVEIARKRSSDFGNVRFEVGRAESLPFEDGSFTVVWTAHSFHHWEDRRAGLAEMRRVLSDGGRAVVLETDGKKHGLDQAGVARVSEAMEDLGFAPVTVEKVDKQVAITGVAAAPLPDSTP